MMHGNGWMGWGYGMGGLGWLGMLFFWVVLIIAIVLAVRWARKGLPPTTGPRESALDILKKRYARGEISREEFERMKRDLE